MKTLTGRWAGAAAIAWTGLYVASKVHLALEERLGVTGGPRVAASAYDDYGPGEVAKAQWVNAGAGAVVIALVLASFLPLRLRLPRVALYTLLGVCFAMVTVGAAGMIGGAILTDRGGATFGGYCAVWALLLLATLRDFHRRERAASQVRADRQDVMA